MKAILLAALVGLAATQASGASNPPALRKPPDLAKDAAAYPTLIGATKAIAKINRALRAANAERSRDIAQCRRDAPDGHDWEQAVDAPLLGARFVSFYVHGSNNCGGAHPNVLDEALVFDVASGERADWKALLPQDLRGQPRQPAGEASSSSVIPAPRLKAAILAAAEKDDLPSECRDAFADGAIAFTLWPDAKKKGLAAHAVALPHRIDGVCGEPVTIPAQTLKQLGVNALLIQDIETGAYQVGQ